MGTLLLALLFDCDYRSMHANEEAAPEGTF